MIETLETFVIGIFCVFVAAVSLFFLYGVFVLVPVSLHADMKCKESGFPRGEVTINLKEYCMNLDGSVTVKVEELK